MQKIIPLEKCATHCIGSDSYGAGTSASSPGLPRHIHMCYVCLLIGVAAHESERGGVAAHAGPAGRVQGGDQLHQQRQVREGRQHPQQEHKQQPLAFFG